MLRKHFNVLAVLVLLTAAIAGCEKGEGPVVEDELFVPPFSAVELNINKADVYITQDTFFRVRVEGQQNIIDLVETDTDGDVWVIEFDGSARKFNRLKFFITMPYVSAVINRSQGDIIGLNDIITDDIFVENFAGGDIQLTIVDATKVETRVNGSGDVFLNGQCNTHNIFVEGSGDLRSWSLYSNVCIIKTLGSGDAEIYGNHLIDIIIEGSGDVYYRGGGDVQFNITGSGNIFNAN